MIPREDIIRMAREAGISYSGTMPQIFDAQDQLERFAALVATHEREKIEKIVETVPIQAYANEAFQRQVRVARETILEAIRSRNTTGEGK